MAFWNRKKKDEIFAGVTKPSVILAYMIESRIAASLPSHITELEKFCTWQDYSLDNDKLEIRFSLDTIDDKKVISVIIIYDGKKLDFDDIEMKGIKKALVNLVDIYNQMKYNEYESARQLSSLDMIENIMGINNE